jgi:alanine racemase
MSRPSRALIDLSALKHNCKLAQSLAPQSSTVAVIKANAYGHGSVAVARSLEPLVDAFAVACCEEALALREAGIKLPFVLLEGFFSTDELQICADNNFWLMLENTSQVKQLIAAQLSQPIPVWLKVDTGMHRLGLQPENFADCYRALSSSPNIAGPVIATTHFACADELDNDFTLRQTERLKAIAAPFNTPLSMANSPALLAWPETRGDWNRPGFMLYGVTPFEGNHNEADKLLPVMTMASKVMSLRNIATGEAVGYGASWRATRPSLIATIPIGYGDGYPRTAQSGTPVMVNGQMAKLAGRVSMDLITVDVTDLVNVAIGDAVECWGKNLSVNEVARHAGTNGYELLTRIPARLPRIYVAD